MNPMTADVRSAFRAALSEAHAPAGASKVVLLPRAQKAPALRPTAGPFDQRRGHFTLKLWLPLTPVWILLAPAALLLAPLIRLAPQAGRVNPYRAALAVGRTLLALSGTVIRVDTPDAVIRLRIF